MSAVAMIRGVVGGPIALALLLLAVPTYRLAASHRPLLNVLGGVPPLASLGLYLPAWLDGRGPAAQGDAQPGLVLVVGAIVTGALLAAAVAGTLAAQPRDGHPRLRR